MTLIIERDIYKKIPIYVKQGRNKGRQTGFVFFEKYKTPYYYVIKNFKSDQMMRNPKHIGELPISETILEDLKKYGVTHIVFMIVGFDNAGSFYIVVLLKDYENSRGYSYDDPQRYINLKDYPRIYPEQGSLKSFLM